jgi:uncharacterized membrane protein
MSFLIFILAVAALIVALKALRDIQPRPGQPTPAERIAGLEERVRDLLYRVWTLEQERGRGSEATLQPEAPRVPAPTDLAPSAHEPLPSPAWTAAAAGAESAAVHPAAPAPAPAPAAPRLDLEQRIGARWTTWVGVVAILFAASFFVKWSIENDLIGPRARLGVGLSSGITLLAAGLALHRRRDVPYLSEGLSGLGLGLCYLSLYAGYAYYALLQAGAAFGLMFIVTVLGTGVAVVSDRQVTAVLALLGGLLTPVLLAQEEPNERVLLGYLLVLDLLVLAIARFRTWTAVNRLAWAGTVLLLAPTFLRHPDAPYPVARLVLLSALFLLFLLTPLAREWRQGGRIHEVDLLVVAGTAAGYFWAVYVTLESWWPLLQAPGAMALAILYTVLAGFYRRRVPDDDATVGVLMGVACVFLTLAMPLALKGPWITLAWAAEGAVLLSVAPRLVTPVAAWGGTAALFLAAFRVVDVDRWGAAYWTPVWNATFLAHLLTVTAIVLAGQLALKLRPGQLLRLSREGLRSTLWVLASLTLSVLLWREPPGLWPAGLLTAQLLVVGFLARVVPSPAFVVVVPLAAFTVLARTLGADDTMARASAEELVNAYTLMRVLACVVVGVAGAGLAASGGTRYAEPVGRALSGAAGVVLLFVLSQAWTRYLNVAIKDMRGPARSAQASELRWRMQLGLSILWTVYAAAALAWGFLRRSVALRYAALCLFGLTIVKVFFVDMASVKTAYRMLSLLVLGIVLLLVGLLYQKASRRSAATGSSPSSS